MKSKTIIIILLLILFIAAQYYSHILSKERLFSMSSNTFEVEKWINIAKNDEYINIVEYKDGEYQPIPIEKLDEYLEKKEITVQRFIPNKEYLEQMNALVGTGGYSSARGFVSKSVTKYEEHIIKVKIFRYGSFLFLLLAIILITRIYFNRKTVAIES